MSFWSMRGYWVLSEARNNIRCFFLEAPSSFRWIIVHTHSHTQSHSQKHEGLCLFTAFIRWNPEESLPTTQRSGVVESRIVFIFCCFSASPGRTQGRRRRGIIDFSVFPFGVRLQEHLSPSHLFSTLPHLSLSRPFYASLPFPSP